MEKGYQDQATKCLQLTHPVLDNGPCKSRTKNARDSTNSVRDAHEYGCILRSNIKMVHTKPCPGQPTQSQGQGQEDSGGAPGHDEGGEDHEDGLEHHHPSPGLHGVLT